MGLSLVLGLDCLPSAEVRVTFSAVEAAGLVSVLGRKLKCFCLSSVGSLPLEKL